MIVDGAKVLDDVRSFIARFCMFPDKHCLPVHALWAAHAHMIEHFYITPRLALVSTEPQSGKTRVLELLNLLVPNPMLSVSASPASIFRTLATGCVTLLFDEVDTIWSVRGKDDNHEDLRALLNAGYKRGATIPRCVGPKHDVQHFRAFCAVALAGIGAMPDTILTRSIIVKMRRRLMSERVEAFRSRQHEPEGHALRDRLAEWAQGVGAAVGAAEPAMPEGIVDRPAEIWEPLIAVADAAGGHWPQTARDACVHLCDVAKDRPVSLRIRLLADTRTIWGAAEDALYSKTIIGRLVKPDEHGLDSDAPWSDLRGKPLSEHALAQLLKGYDVKSTKVRESGGPALMGYRRADLWDAWQRYLPPMTENAEQPEQSELVGLGVGSSAPVSARDVPFVPDVPFPRTPERDDTEYEGSDGVELSA